MVHQSNHGSSEIIDLLRSKILQIFRLYFIKYYIDWHRKSFEVKDENRNAFLTTLYSSLDFSHFMLLSRIFDNDVKVFSVTNIAKILGNYQDPFFKDEIIKNHENIKLLFIWRANVFAHDNFNVALSSVIVDDIHPNHMLDFNFIELQYCLVNLFCRYNYYIREQKKTYDEIKLEFIKVLKDKE